MVKKILAATFAAVVFIYLIAQIVYGFVMGHRLGVWSMTIMAV